MLMEVNQQWEDLFDLKIQLRVELNRYKGEGSRISVLEARNASLKKQLKWSNGQPRLMRTTKRPWPNGLLHVQR
jgi:hypothetical protein